MQRRQAEHGEVMKAITMVQKFLRRKRWYKLIGTKIPLVEGPCGLRFFPIYNSAMKLEGVQGETKDYKGTALWCLSPNSWFRLLFIAIVEWEWFERLSLFVVVSNCMMLAMQGPPGSNTGPEAAFYEAADLGFTYMFTVELMLRSVAMGFRGHPDSYLADHWNKLDCFVVVASWLPLIIPSLSHMNALRAVRALRPLRTINRLPLLRKQVETLLESLPQLLDVAMLSGFIMVVFGVLGVQLFQGTLLYRCYEADAPLGASPVDPRGDSIAGVCAPSAEVMAFGVEGRSEQAWSSLSEQGSCPDAGQACKFYGVNPLYGTISFDDIGSAWMTIYQCVTLEGWTDVLYMTARVSGVAAGAYFISLVIFGSFYVLNLFLAVMWHVNNRPQSQLLAELEAEAKKKPKKEKDGSFQGSQQAAEESRHSALPAAARSRSPAGTRSFTRRASTIVSCEAFVGSSAFQGLSIGLIVVNVGIMMLERYPMSPELGSMLEASNLILTVRRQNAAWLPRLLNPFVPFP